MSKQLPPEFRGAVPIVGQRVELHATTVIGAIRCGCRPNNPPLLLPSFGAGALCAHCGNVYGFIAVHVDRRTGQDQVLVDVVDRVPVTAQAAQGADQAAAVEPTH